MKRSFDKKKIITQNSLVVVALISAFALAPFSHAKSLNDEGFKLRCEMAPKIIKAYFTHHVATRQLNDEIRDRTFDNYIKRVDPQKQYFLKSEVKVWKKSVLSVFDTMVTGKCSQLNDVQKGFIASYKRAEDYVREVLSDKKYKLDDKAKLIIDTDKLSYASNEEELKKRILNQIHFQVSNYLEADTPIEEAKKLLIHRYELRSKRMRDDKADDMLAAFIDSFASALDPHSSFLSADVLEDFNISMGLSLEGIGVSLSSKDGYTIVQKIIPGGAASRVKSLKNDDRIVAVKQEDEDKTVNIVDMDLRDVVRLIRGKKGTKVTLTVLRKSSKETKRFQTTIVRDKVDLKEQAAKLEVREIEIDGRKLRLGVIDLPSFYGGKGVGSRSSYRDMRRLVKKASKEKVDGLLLDLSRNSGGILDDSVKISGYFIREGGVVATQLPSQPLDVMRDTDKDTLYSGPMVVLTSRMSASASEILAGALKDYNRAVIVGADHTFGKGSIQNVIPLPKGLGALKVTTGRFFRPGGWSTQKIGVKSHIPLPSLLNSKKIGESELENALQEKQISPFVSNLGNEKSNPDKAWEPITDKVVATLERNSEARIKKSKEFKELRDKIKEAEEEKDFIVLADLLKKTKEKDGGKKKDEEDEDLEEEYKKSATYQEAINILADLVILQKKPVLGKVSGKEAGIKN